MTKFVIHAGGQARVTAAWEVLAEAWAEMVRAGNAPYLQGVAPVGPQHEVLYATEEGRTEVVGVVAWTRSNGILQIDLVYVEPASRRQGVATRLIDELLERSPAGSRLLFNVDGENKAMDALLEKRKALVARTVFELEA